MTGTHIMTVTVPFAAGVLGLPSQIHPEVSWFLALCNDMLFPSGDDVCQGFSHLSLIPTASLQHTHESNLQFQNVRIESKFQRFLFCVLVCIILQLHSCLYDHTAIRH